MALKRWTALMAVAGMAAACGGRQRGGATRPDGAGGDSASAEAGSGGLLFPGSGGANASGAAGIPDVCGGTAYKADLAPVGLYVMLSQSSAMAAPLTDSNPPMSWWQAMEQGVASLISDPKAGGAEPGAPAMGVGIQFFPLDGSAPQSCTADYQTPEVEIGLLPGNGAAITKAMQQHEPTSGRPTSAALSGAIAHMKEWSVNHPSRIPAVVLVTDGPPTECGPQDIAGIAQIAKVGFETPPHIRTFVLGLNLGAAGLDLEPITAAAGTGKPLLIDGGDVGAQFVDAMLSISSIPYSSCTFELPIPPEGVAFDPMQVAVTFTPSKTEIEAQLPFLGSLGDCALNDDQGWFYDSATAPTEIEVCPGTCAKFGAGVVKVAYGCMHRTGMTH